VKWTAVGMDEVSEYSQLLRLGSYFAQNPRITAKNHCIEVAAGWVGWVVAGMAHEQPWLFEIGRRRRKKVIMFGREGAQKLL